MGRRSWPWTSPRKRSSIASNPEPRRPGLRWQRFRAVRGPSLGRAPSKPTTTRWHLPLGRRRARAGAWGGTAGAEVRGGATSERQRRPRRRAAPPSKQTTRRPQRPRRFRSKDPRRPRCTGCVPRRAGPTRGDTWSVRTVAPSAGSRLTADRENAGGRAGRRNRNAVGSARYGLP